ncbi:MAG TPA: DHHA1 domain-containing protein, partial [Terriglobales bacterium]|nr:DHHA1 domain-containing protein [Terriglobales bacterium]
GAELEAVLDHTPFYAASGGQVGDRGVWTTASGLAAEVLDTYAPVSGLTVHRIRARLPLRVGERVEAEVDVARRDATRRNHTATHLLHAALRRVLGTHVKQAGSVVDPDRLRFDFTHFSPLTAEQTEEIERLVNAEILRNEAVMTEILPLEAALESGAMALFGEKYQEQVRVVAVAGFSKELCGGTHARRTGDLGLFKVAYESSVAAGVRRIEALTGEGAIAQFRAATAQLHRLAALLHAQPSELSGSLERLLAHQHQTEEENQRLKMQAARSSAGAAERQRDVDGVSVLTTRVDGLDRAQMRALVDQLRARHPQGVIALGSAPEDGAGKAALIVAVSAELSRRVPAGAVIKAIPGATGGGRPEMAEGGAKEAGQIDALLEAVGTAVAQALIASAKKEAVK